MQNIGNILFYYRVAYQKHKKNVNLYPLHLAMINKYIFNIIKFYFSF